MTDDRRGAAWKRRPIWRSGGRSTSNASPERAFDVFTRGIASWWPLETHSIGAMRGAPPQELHLELREGGRFYERTDGEERSWGRVLAYDPPRRDRDRVERQPREPAHGDRGHVHARGRRHESRARPQRLGALRRPDRDARVVRQRERLDDGARPLRRSCVA